MRRALLTLVILAGACGSSIASVPSSTIGPAISETAPSTTKPTTTTAATSAPIPSSAEPTITDPALKPQAELLVDRLEVLAEETGGSPVRVGLVAHRASQLPEGRTIDIIAEADVAELVRIFAPEHGLAGNNDAGAPVDDGFETVTGVPIRSLYGERRSPDPADLADLDIVIYDLQDVGVRAYTYIATMGLVMEAAADADVPFVVLDRPNPQGTEIDGPILDSGLESFISPYPIPTAYGLSSGELAQLLIDEEFVDAPDLTFGVVLSPWNQPVMSETEWIPPSPNLPTLRSAWLYPALVPFEATVLSVGRGTDQPFTLIGGSDIDGPTLVEDLASRPLQGVDVTLTQFTPRSIPGMAERPRYEGELLDGVALDAQAPLPRPLRTSLELLDAFMDASPDRAAVIDRPDVFDRLIGSASVRKQLVDDVDPQRIADSWTADVAEFRTMAETYRERTD